MFLLAVALGAEWKMAGNPTRGWAVASGLGWGMALWTSLYEPVILLALVLALYGLFNRRALRNPARYPCYAVFLGVIVLGLAVDGVPASVPTPTILHYFPAWEKTIGELRTATPFDSLLYRWVGFGLIAPPLLLALAWRRDRRAGAMLAVVFAAYLLTLSQIRWGYFFGIVFAMSLPWQLAVFPRRWMGWCFSSRASGRSPGMGRPFLLNEANRERAIEE